MKNLIIEDYLKSQHEFIKSWSISPENEFEKSIFSKLKSVNSQILPFLNYLPEPYLGNPYNSDGVFLNYNPGPVLEEEQNRQNGTFIKKLNAIDDYHFFANNVTYFKGQNGFWKVRQNFLSRFLDKPFDETSLFALEICPFHSSSFKLSQKDISNSSFYIENSVLKIAEEVAKLTTIKTIISIGKNYYDLFKILNYKLIREINQSADIDNWPTKGNGEKTNRCISLWQSPSGGFYFNTWAPGSNKMPQKEFDKIIKEFISI